MCHWSVVEYNSVSLVSGGMQFCVIGQWWNIIMFHWSVVECNYVSLVSGGM